MPGFDLATCPDLAVPADVMHHVVQVESSYNPYAIGVVGGRLARQPRTLREALATARMLEARGYDFSLGLAQINRRNLGKYGLGTYARAFEACPNLQAGARILAECHARAHGDWGRAFSCYYAGDFSTGYRHGYVQKVFASMGATSPADTALAIPVIARLAAAAPQASSPAARAAVAQPEVRQSLPPLVEARIAGDAVAEGGPAAPAARLDSRDQAFVF